MQTVTPYDEADNLGTLFSPVDKTRFQSTVSKLHTLFEIYANTCPLPLPAPGLIITPEIRSQCERYLPLADIATAFNNLYSAALSYEPIFSSTPFHDAMSWADAFMALPTRFQFSADPARLLKALLDNGDLLTSFLFASFLPDRFYGGVGRYPGQLEFIREWVKTRTGPLHCLDTACGAGEDTYALALLLSEEGFSPDGFRIAGLTLEPLEVWSAAQRRFPHDRHREELLRGATFQLFKQGYGRSISFHCQDILKLSSLEMSDSETYFNLIICNGLLGGPIIHGRKQLDLVVGNLARLLAPGGILLAADNFHGGWKQKCPQGELRASFEAYRLNTFEAGEGIGGLKSDQ